MAEAVCANRSGRFETEVTCKFISCSILSFFNADRLVSGRWAAESGRWADARSATPTRPNVKSIRETLNRIGGRPREE
jgi:hypothetical protein